MQVSMTLNVVPPTALAVVVTVAVTVQLSTTLDAVLLTVKVGILPW